MHAQTLLAIFLPILATANVVHSSASANSAIPSSSSNPSVNAHAPNTGNSYGTDDISNKGNLACTGKCHEDMEDLECPVPYVATPNEKDECFLCCVNDD
ncbi:hypothetical protein LTS12_029183 [Elasticomyces elasticus]|nr:hypothetical protein LTS12_029183 [Elasticomyces elasticus]